MITPPPPIPQLTDEQREALRAHIAKVNAQLRAIVEAVMPAMRAAAEQMAQMFNTLREAGLLDDEGKPTTPTDRPAWQSPYGPAQKGHRR